MATLSIRSQRVLFIRNMHGRSTHCDPDWGNLTYGDKCSNRRAAALRRVEAGDILLFWGMLWRNDGKTRNPQGERF
jgi:hypothetical protein